MKRKLFISQDLEIEPEKVLLIGDFIVFCCDALPVRGDCKVYIVSNRDLYSITTTAAYLVGEGEIRVYGKNRAVADVMRSIAHEMTHMMQDEQNLLHGNIRDAGGFHEDQANAKAGELIKLYAKKPGRRKIYENISRKTI
jgi:hypothetical protein